MGGMRKWRRHTLDFKRQVVDKMKTCGNIEALARELDLQRKLLYTWKWQLEGRPEPQRANLEITAEERGQKQLREKIANLQATVSRTTEENHFFAIALLRIEKRQSTSETGVEAPTQPSSRRRKSKAN